MNKKCVFLVGTRWFGVLGPCSMIISELVENGLDVFVFGQKDEHYGRYDDGKSRLIKINMKRSYFTPVSDLMDVGKLIYYIIKYRPVAIHSFNPKPSLICYSSVIWFSSVKFFIGVTGLGNTFIRAPKLSKIITIALRKACGRCNYVFFQNTDDIELFERKQLVSIEKTLMFTGPGVDLKTFYPLNNEIENDGLTVRIGCTARLIWQKGIKEYVTAASELMEETDLSVKLEFYLYGEIDEQHPDCVDPAFIERYVKAGVLKHIPWTDNIADEIRRLDIFVLHSYREGAPRAILEASACSIPTIGSDAIGVRELVIDGVTGYLTPLHNVEAMKDRIRELALDKDRRNEMGKQAKVMIGEKFSLENSSNAQLEMYRASDII